MQACSTLIYASVLVKIEEVMKNSNLPSNEQIELRAIWNEFAKDTHAKIIVSRPLIVGKSADARSNTPSRNVSATRGRSLTRPGQTWNQSYMERLDEAYTKLKYPSLNRANVWQCIGTLRAFLHDNVLGSMTNFTEDRFNSEDFYNKAVGCINPSKPNSEWMSMKDFLIWYISKYWAFTKAPGLILSPENFDNCVRKGLDSAGTGFFDKQPPITAFSRKEGTDDDVEIPSSVVIPRTNPVEIPIN